MKTTIYFDGTGFGFENTNIQRLLKEAREYARTFADVSTETLIENRDVENAVRKNLLWAVKLASKFSSSKYPLSELISPAFYGLNIAVRKFNPEKAQFVTYATFWIRKYILDYINSQKLELDYYEEQLNPPQPKTELKTTELKEFIGKTLEILQPKERFVIEKIFFDNWDRESIALELNMTTEGVRKIRRRALEKMRQFAQAI